MEIPADNSDLLQPTEEIDLKQVPIETLTGGIESLESTGCFDETMKAVEVHLQREYASQRITGNLYAQSYIAAMNTALQVSNQFALQGQEAYWKAKGAEAQCRLAEAQIRKLIKDIELVEAQIEGQKLQNELLEKQMWLQLQQILTEQAKTQDLIGFINPQNPLDHETIFTPSREIGGNEGAQIAVAKTQNEELKKTGQLKLAEHYFQSFSVNQSSLTDLSPSKFGYNGSRVKAVEDKTLLKYGFKQEELDALDAKLNEETDTDDRGNA